VAVRADRHLPRPHRKTRQSHNGSRASDLYCPFREGENRQIVMSSWPAPRRRSPRTPRSVGHLRPERRRPVLAQATHLTQRHFNRSSTLVRDRGRMTTRWTFRLARVWAALFSASGPEDYVDYDDRDADPRCVRRDAAAIHVRGDMNFADDNVDIQIRALFGLSGPRCAGYPGRTVSRSPPQEGRCRSQAAHVNRLADKSRSRRNTLLNR
jgi:hypothetical protein